MMEEMAERTRKLFILGALCSFTAGTSILLQYSRQVRKETYSSVDIILVGELFKVVISAYLVTSSASADKEAFVSKLWSLWHLFKSGREMLLLVVLYSISNVSGVVALSLIGAAWHTVLVQLKILTTALFAVCFLQRRYSSTKWRALVLLVLGAILVTSPVINKAKNASEGGSNAEESTEQVVLGVFLVLTQATISGFSSVYFEKILKKEGKQPTIWERNFQLAVYSVLVLSLSNMFQNMRHQLFSTTAEEAVAVEFFKDWTPLACLIGVMSGSTGLIIAATLKYADAVLKCLATSCAIIVTSAAGVVFFHSEVDMFVAIGMMVVIVGVFNYTLDATPSE